MLVSFACAETERIFREERSRRLPPDIQNTARRKLEYLHRVRLLNDLRMPPGNPLDALAGILKGQHSIRVNDQRRICFVWRNGNAEQVEIVDYHRMVMSKPKNRLNPVHPGDVLREDL